MTTGESNVGTNLGERCARVVTLAVDKITDHVVKGEPVDTRRRISDTRDIETKRECESRTHNLGVTASVGHTSTSRSRGIVNGRNSTLIAGAITVVDDDFLVLQAGGGGRGPTIWFGVVSGRVRNCGGASISIGTGGSGGADESREDNAGNT